MNLITCSSACFYQVDGYCTLEILRSNGSHPVDGCIHFMPRAASAPGTHCSENRPDLGDGAQRDER